MAEIRVDARGREGFLVTIEGHGTETRHLVTVPQALVDQVAPGSTPAAVVEASFRFLLDREPKESILGEFELGVIGRYFPEYESALSGYLETHPDEKA